jgi:peptide/nickel transport system substrate-binding protein/oligopeptide transport system substrate-binding protein
MRNFGRSLNIFVVFLVAIISLITISALGGCGDNSTDKSAGDKNGANLSFSYAEASDPSALDPALVDESIGGNIARYLFDGLVSYDSSSGEVKPAVAESWDFNDEATVITFHLRKGVNFTNGRAVNAQDFVYAWTRALDPATKSSMASTILEPVKGAGELSNGETNKLAGVEAVDDSTLKVTLNYPQAEFVTFLGHPVCAPVPAEEAGRADQNYSEKPVGNGAFKLTEWKKGESVLLERNDDYYGDKAKVGQVTVKFIPNPSTSIAELKAGNVDIVKIVPPGQTQALRSDSSVKIYDGKVDALRFAGFNLTGAPWKDNDKLRQAINYAIDRDTIAGKVLQGQEAPADGIVPAGMKGHQNNAMPYTYDPEKAKQLLADAGFPEGKGLPPLVLTYPNEGPAADVAQAMQAQLKAVGIPVEINGMEMGGFLDEMSTGKLSFFLISWVADYPSLDTFLYTLFHSANIGAQNVFQYSNPDVDVLLDKARSTKDESKRTETYNEAERKILADAPLVPVAFSVDVMAVSPRVTKFVDTPLGDLALNEIEVSDK